MGAAVIVGVGIFCLATGLRFGSSPASLLESRSVNRSVSEDDLRDSLTEARGLIEGGNAELASEQLLQIAEAAQKGDGVAWDAAEELSRLPGFEVQAADAFLAAFASGVESGRRERVAEAQDRVGRRDIAARIREVGLVR